MRILIDTHILIWHLEGNAQLSPDRRNIIADAANNILISKVSLWEIAVKLSLGKLQLAKSLKEIISEIEFSTSELLPIENDHILSVASLPFHHKDPFDRLMIAQALTENIPVITSDPDFASYGVKTR